MTDKKKGKKKATKLAVGDVFRSAEGMYLEITDIDVEAETITVSIERNIVSRDGERKTESRKRVIPKHLWRVATQQYDHDASSSSSGG